MMIDAIATETATEEVDEIDRGQEAGREKDAVTEVERGTGADIDPRHHHVAR